MDISAWDADQLRWMVKCNGRKQAMGFLGPTVKRKGPVPEMQPLVDAGLCRVVCAGRLWEFGYWITDAGRAALSKATPTTGGNDER